MHQVTLADRADTGPGQTPEHARRATNGDGRWWRWGPYLSERQWGTVREDYSPHGTAWDYFPHDHARSRAYRWGEDGIAGFSDEGQRLCLSVAMWNGRDPILKERLFGLTNSEGNHGEDVKEIYYYLDATPTHSYLRALYKYPQEEFPYRVLVEENARRGLEDREFELRDTGVFDADRYFDVYVEYAKADPDDILMVVEAHNRASEAATLHLLPQIVFRNTWSWNGGPRPTLDVRDGAVIEASHPEMPGAWIHVEGDPLVLFTDNETNAPRLSGAAGVPGARYKDAFHDAIVAGDESAVRTDGTGTKAGFLHVVEIPAGGSKRVRLRVAPRRMEAPFADFDDVVELRKAEADQFYGQVMRGHTEDERLVERQAYAGLIWSKQRYEFDVATWLDGDPAQPPPPEGRRHGRNRDWRHFGSQEVVSMPDTWEYPWYAAWDLAFHMIPMARIDPEFAKGQLVLLTREWHMHANGQLPAYEWSFGDVNPPVHAWAAWKVYQIDREESGVPDTAFLERVFHKLLLNFTWWVNRKDREGHNIFQGGFLGLDNIGVFDRAAPLPTGGYISQADGTAWMAMYSLNMMQIAVELALYNPVYQDTATKFFEHFLAIAEAMTNIGDEGIGLWDSEDEFFYDALNLPDGERVMLKARSLVGLTPLFAVAVLEPSCLRQLPDFAERLHWYLDHRPDLAALVSHWEEPGLGDRRLLSLLRGHRMKRLIARLLDETEFLSEYGVRSLSRHHLDDPYVLTCGEERRTVRYEPAESRSRMFGGNSNWRGPIWFPMNFLLIESLMSFHGYYGDDFKIECPTGSGAYTTLRGAAEELARRLCRIFLRDAEGVRPVFGGDEKVQADLHFRDHLLFYEYFHGDSGRGMGASHQTGWTALVAELMRPLGPPSPSCATREAGPGGSAGSLAGEAPPSQL